MIEYLFLDLDDTILDFGSAEAAAIHRTLEESGIAPTTENKALYSRINKELWKMLERGEITREALKVVRFSRLFAELGSDADPEVTAQRYILHLGEGHDFLPGALEAVQQLHRCYRLFLASNGNADVQQRRMTGANLYPYFEQCFVSEELGANKPSLEFYDRAAARIHGFDPKKCMMVGDSLTSDILGGIRAGMKTCWINPNHKPGREDIRPDYELECLAQLPQLLKALQMNIAG